MATDRLSHSRDYSRFYKMRWITTGYDDMVWLSNAHSCLIPEWLFWNNAETAKISKWKTGYVPSISILRIKRYSAVYKYWSTIHCTDNNHNFSYGVFAMYKLHFQQCSRSGVMIWFDFFFYKSILFWIVDIEVFFGRYNMVG